MDTVSVLWVSSDKGALLELLLWAVSLMCALGWLNAQMECTRLHRWALEAIELMKWRNVLIGEVLRGAK